MLELTLEQGFGKTSVREILERAEVARSTFYAHFKDKDDLLLGGFTLFQLQPVKEDPTDGSLPLPELGRIFSHVGLNLDLFQALQAGGDLPGPLNQARRDLECSYQVVFEDLIVRGYALSGEPPLLATFFAGALMAVLVDWLERGVPETPEVMAERFQNMVQRGARAS